MSEKKGPAAAASQVDKAKARESVNKISAKADERVLGWQVWWDLSRTGGKRGDLEKKLSAIGQSEAMQPPLTAEARLKLAGQRALASGHGVGVKLEWKKASRVGPVTVYRPVRRTVVQDGTASEDAHKPSLAHATMAAVSVNRESMALSLQDQDCPVGQAVAREYAALDGAYTVNEVRRTIMHILDGLNAIKLRTRGGIFFVPAGAGVRKKLDQLKHLVESEGDSELYTPGIPADGEWTRAARASIGRSLDFLYADLVSDAREFVATMTNGDLANSRALTAKVAQVSNLRQRIEQYREILAGRSDTLLSATDVLRDSIKDMMEHSVEIRALRKAKGSDVAQKAAAQLLTEVAKKAADKLNEAVGVHRPLEISEDEEE